MLDKQTDIAATISARICHDLISPIGAISNGLELLALSGAPQPSELTLISKNLRNANAKICYLRIAFADNAATGTVSVSETKDILAGYYDTARLTLNRVIASPRFEVIVFAAFVYRKTGNLWGCYHCGPNWP